LAGTFQNIDNSSGEEIKENLITSYPRLKRSFLKDKISFVEINQDISLWTILESFSFKTVFI
tara:strand:- start:137 stop:322 length:186 start_codon:yes stop_codon:yes gene_type:complete